jgi:general secretion pathway protein D
MTDPPSSDVTGTAHQDVRERERNGELAMRNFLLSLLAGASCLAQTNGWAATTAKPATKVDAAAQAAHDEIVRRQEAQLTARKLIDQADKLAAAGNTEGAIAKYDEALKLLPRAKATEKDRARAVRGVTNAYNHLAENAYRAGDSAKATQLANKSLEYEAGNSGAKSIIAKAQKAAGRPAVAVASGEVRPDRTPEFLGEREQIKKLFREGKIMLNSGQLDEADRRFQQILAIDPYNEDAHVLIGEVNKQRLGIAQTGADLTRTRRLWEVTDSWIPPLSREVEVPKPGETAGAIGATAARQADLTKKLNSIIIPDINFRDAVITDVVGFLSAESRRLDPDRVGVNIVLQLGESAPAPAAPMPGTEGTPEAAPESSAMGGPEVRKVTLSLQKIPLIEALKYVTQVAGLKFRIEPSAVLILPKEAPEGDMIVRTYPVESGAVREVLTAPTETSERTSTEEFQALGTGPGATLTRTDLRQFFIDAGVPFPAGSSLAYNERTSTIIVRNTPENIETFERVLSALNVVPNQVEIEAKFVEISQQDLDELGFRWLLGQHQEGDFLFDAGDEDSILPGGPPNSLTDELTGGLRDSTTIQANAVDVLLASSGFGVIESADSTVGAFRGILTDPQFSLIVKALSQKRSADLLSAPKVTTISGNTAQMKVVREFIYPTEFSLPQVGDNVVSPSIPQSFKTREIGVLLNVTPTVGADGYTINLTIVPEVSDFEGFLDYSPGVTVQSVQTGGTNFVNFVSNRIFQPLFNSRNLSTSIVIWDGQTVVLGGLIREDMQKLDDKVPLLGDLPFVGRLFRSKTTIRTKRNLLVFVSARLIDPSGNLIHRRSLAAR